MENEPFFLVNEFLEKEKAELENILNTINNYQHKDMERAVFLRNFSNQLFKAHKKTKQQEKPKIDQKKFEKELLEKKKQELLKKIEDMKSKQQPAAEKTIELETPKLTEEKSIILSKESKKTLASIEFNGITYNVKEPELSENDIKILNELKTQNIEQKETLVNRMKDLSKKYNIIYSDEYYDKIRYFLVRDIKKYGKISPLIEDKEVKDIICAGKDKPISIMYKDKEVPTNIILSDEEINNFVKETAAKTAQQISEAKPFLNVPLDNMTISANIGTAFIKPKFVITKI